MDQFARTADASILLALAAALRRLADDSLYRGDQALYLLTADALERRAERLAPILPEQYTPLHDGPTLHSPVDMTI